MFVDINSSHIILLTCGIYTLSAYVWRKFEIKYFGKLKPNKYHTYYTLVFSFLWALTLLYVPYLTWLGVIGVIASYIWVLIVLIKVLYEHNELQKFNKELIEENKELLNNLNSANKNTKEALEIISRQREALQSLGKDLKF